MKKIFTFLMVCLVGILGVFGLTSCGGNKENYDEYKIADDNTYVFLTQYFFTCGPDNMVDGETKNKTKLGLVFINNNQQEMQVKAIKFDGEIIEITKKDKDVTKMNPSATYYETNVEFPASKAFFEDKKITNIYYTLADGNKIVNHCESSGIKGFYDIDTWLSFYK